VRVPECNDVLLLSRKMSNSSDDSSAMGRGFALPISTWTGAPAIVAARDLDVARRVRRCRCERAPAQSLLDRRA
jgi:hypothetical protein